MLTLLATSTKVLDPKGKGTWITYWQGQRTLLGDYSVETVRSGYEFKTKARALEWAEVARVPSEQRELNAAAGVQAKVSDITERRHRK